MGATPRNTTLNDLGLSAPVGARGIAITGLAVDSRHVAKGVLFAALPGARAHGASFAAQATAQGAAAILTDPEGARIVQDSVPTHPRWSP